MRRRWPVRGSAVERIRESRPKNNPFTGTELIFNPWCSQFNEVTPKHHSMGSNWWEFSLGLVVASRRWRWRIQIGGGAWDCEDCWNVLPVARIGEASLDISSVGQIILYLAKANRRKVCRIPGEYKAHRIFFARIVGHDYIRET